MTVLSLSIKNISKAFKKFEDNQKVATYRTLNIQSNRALKVVLKEIKDETGIKQTTIKKSIKVTKATKNTPFVSWRARGKRLALTSPRKLKRGISFTARGRTRKKLVDSIKGGSRPFIIKGKNSGKNLPVYRAKGNKRKVTTIKGSSVPFLLGVVGVDQKRFQKLVMRNIAKEYSKQLKKASFRGLRVK